MNITLSYSLAELHESAKFIWENNSVVRNWPTAPSSVFDIINYIRNMMIVGAKNNVRAIMSEKNRINSSNITDNWQTYIGTGGFYILYSCDNENDLEICISASILIDTAVTCPDRGYHTEPLDINP